MQLRSLLLRAHVPGDVHNENPVPERDRDELSSSKRGTVCDETMAGQLSLDRYTGEGHHDATADRLTKDAGRLKDA
jgi:hypothetical protein